MLPMRLPFDRLRIYAGLTVVLLYIGVFGWGYMQHMGKKLAQSDLRNMADNYKAAQGTINELGKLIALKERQTAANEVACTDRLKTESLSVSLRDDKIKTLEAMLGTLRKANRESTKSTLRHLDKIQEYVTDANKDIEVMRRENELLQSFVNNCTFPPSVTRLFHATELKRQ